MDFKGLITSFFVLSVLTACSHLPGSSEFVCNDAAVEPPVQLGVDSRGQFLAVVLNALASLGSGRDFKKESIAALNRCDQEFLIWYVQMSGDDPERLTDYDRKRFTRLTKDS